MDTDRVDLSALDLPADVERWERLVQGILWRAAPELARRAAVGGTFELLGSWARPMIAAAAAVAAVATATMLRVSGPAELQAGSGQGVVEALHVPEPLAHWLAEDRGPTVADLVLTLEDDHR